MIGCIDGARLKSERRKQRWSQDQLAAISGVSLRTIQRLETGKPATPTSLRALALALSLPETELIASGRGVRRVTPLTIVAEIDQALIRYRNMGFHVIETDDPGCVGIRAGASYLILSTVGFMRHRFKTAEMDAHVGETLPYIWVASLEAGKAGYDRVLDQFAEPDGFREAIVEREGRWAILAETPT